MNFTPENTRISSYKLLRLYESSLIVFCKEKHSIIKCSFLYLIFLKYTFNNELTIIEHKSKPIKQSTKTVNISQRGVTSAGDVTLSI